MIGFLNCGNSNSLTAAQNMVHCSYRVWHINNRMLILLLFGRLFDTFYIRLHGVHNQKLPTKGGCWA